MVVAFAVLLNNAPGSTLGTGTIFTTKFAVAIAELPAFDVHVVAAVDTFHPVSHYLLLLLA